MEDLQKIIQETRQDEINPIFDVVMLRSPQSIEVNFLSYYNSGSFEMDWRSFWLTQHMVE